MTVWLQDYSALFADAYTKMVSQRTTLGLAAMQPAALVNFQFGPEYLEQEQVAPRIVIVPVTSDFNFAQRSPAAYVPTATPIAKSLYTRVETFEAHIWGDPDPAQLDPLYSLNSTLEMAREFIGAMYTSLMGGRGPAAGLTPVSGAWRTDPRGVGMVNTYGRLYVLTFTVSMPVLRDTYTSLDYATAKTDPANKVRREIVQQVTDPVAGTNPVVIPPTIEVP